MSIIGIVIGILVFVGLMFLIRWISKESEPRHKIKGCAGIDGKTIEDIEKEGGRQFLEEIQKDLKEKRYKPDCIKRVYIPKPNGDKRPLEIPIIKDRVIQMAVKIVIEPIFEYGLTIDNIVSYSRELVKAIKV